MTTKHSPSLSAIVAMSENRIIGLNNRLPWHLPADLKHFKTLTSGHAIIMGRNTYESIGKPLPNRTNIILTQHANWQIPGCIIATNINDALEQAKKIEDQEIFVIGGAKVYQAFMPLLQRIYLTIVHHEFHGDTYFPELNPHEWQEVERTRYSADDTNPYDYSFITLEKRS